MSWKLKILWILKSLLLTLISPWHQQRRLKTKLYDKLDFQVNFPFISSNIQHHQHMEFTFHNSFVILELVTNTVIFGTDLSCWRKSYSNKAALLLSWNHRYKNATVVITIWLTVMKYPYLKWQWIFSFIRRCFLASMTHKTFTGLDCIYE